MSTISPAPVSQVPIPAALPAAQTATARSTARTTADQWWNVAGWWFAAVAVLDATAWLSAHAHPSHAVHTAALFVHLASLILGFGGVLIADYFGLLWLTGRCPAPEAFTTISRLHLPIWAGLAGLVASGSLLHSDFSAPAARVNLMLVAILTFNGLQTRILSARLTDPLPRPILRWALSSAAVSQFCWWGSIAIGFSTSQR